MTARFFFAVSVLLTLSFAAQSQTSTESGTTTSMPQENVVPVLPAFPKWKTNFFSTFVDLTGTRDANANRFVPYGFGEIQTKIQTFNFQYSLDSGWTAAVTANYLEYNVDTKILGQMYYDSTRGLGDTTVQMITPPWLSGSWIVAGDLGLSLPTGTIDNRNPAAPTVDYAYNMQLGSGTFDPVAGVSAVDFHPDYQIGTRLSTIVRNSKNNNGYRLGNQYQADAWLDVPVKYGFTPRLVGLYKMREGITGSDYTFARQELVEYYFHDQINYSLSAALKYQVPVTRSVNFAAEIGVPLAQNVINYDDVIVSMLYYGTVSLTGSF